MPDDSFFNSAGFGVIIGAVSTFAATYFTNRHANKQLLCAQEHERRLQREQQDFDCKRTALSKAAATTAKHFLYLANALDRSMAEISKGETASELTAAHTELHLYVGIETIEASQALTKQFALFSNAVVKAMMPMEFAEADANGKKYEIENFQRLLDQKQNEIEVLLEDQKSNSSLITALYQTKGQIYKDLGAKQAEYHEAVARKNEAKLEALPILSQQMIACIPSLTDFLIAARTELGIATNETRYKAAVSGNANEAQALITDMLVFVKKAVADEIAKNR